MKIRKANILEIGTFSHLSVLKVYFRNRVYTCSTVSISQINPNVAIDGSIN